MMVYEGFVQSIAEAITQFIDQRITSSQQSKYCRSRPSWHGVSWRLRVYYVDLPGLVWQRRMKLEIFYKDVPGMLHNWDCSPAVDAASLST